MAATYESASTRQFALARTETIRTQSPECLAFCKAMCDPSASVSEDILSVYFLGVFAVVVYLQLPLSPTLLHHPPISSSSSLDPTSV